MIVDTSALVSIVLEEPGYSELVEKLTSSPYNGIGAPTLVELGLVTSKRMGEDPHGMIAYLAEEFALRTVVFHEKHWHAAVDAYQRFGRGRHPAKLNFGDCMTYAVAKLADEPLLFVGDDFSQTDLKVA